MCGGYNSLPEIKKVAHTSLHQLGLHRLPSHVRGKSDSNNFPAWASQSKFWAHQSANNCRHREAACFPVHSAQLVNGVFTIGRPFSRHGFGLNVQHNGRRCRLRVTVTIITRNFCRRRFLWKPCMEERTIVVITSAFPHFYVLSVMCLARLGSNGNLLCRCGSFLSLVCSPRHVSVMHTVIGDGPSLLRLKQEIGTCVDVEDHVLLGPWRICPFGQLFTHPQFVLVWNLECWLVSSCRSNCITSGNYIFLLFKSTLLLCSMLWCSTVWLRCLGTRIPTYSFRNLIRNRLPRPS